MTDSKADLSQDIKDGNTKKISHFRIAFPQVLASSVKNLILIDLGMCVAFPTIVIPALQNSSGPLSLNDEQTSWFGSVGLMVQPIGSIASGIVLERLGRKRSMIVVNFPHIIGWLLYYFCQSTTVLFFTAILMGLGVGFMEAPVITYVAEISQPHLRGVLTSYAGICVQLGFFIEYLLGTMTDWKTAAIISVGVPIFTVIALTQVPETPVWLLSRGREQDAEKSLQWLRGWVSPESVRKEFSELVHYNKELQDKKKKLYSKGQVNKGFVDSSENDVKPNPNFETKCTDIEIKNEPEKEKILNLSVTARLRELFRKETLRPLLLVIVYFFIFHASGISGIRPFMVKVFEEFGMPIDAHWAAVVSAIIGFAGNFLCMSVVHWVGKRPLSLVSVFTLGLSALLLGTYAYLVITSEPGADTSQFPSSWIPPTLFFIMFFSHSFGAGPIPWMMLSEVFPFSTRGLASGIAAAIFYVMAFAFSKTFFAMKSSLHMEGVFWLYGVLTFMGLVYLYIELYETEGKSLEEIEDHYRGKGKTETNFEDKYSVINIENIDVIKVKPCHEMDKEQMIEKVKQHPEEIKHENKESLNFSDVIPKSFEENPENKENRNDESNLENKTENSNNIVNTENVVETR